MKTKTRIACRGLLLLAGLMWVSCVEFIDRVDPSNPEQGGGTKLIFTISGANSVNTRSAGTSNENKISEAIVIGFQEGKIAFIKVIMDLEPTGSGAENGRQYSSQIEIPVGVYQNLTVLANLDYSNVHLSSNESDNFEMFIDDEKYLPGEELTPEQLARLVVITNEDAWDIEGDDYIPMWGELKNQKVTASTRLEFHMIRSLAKITVTVPFEVDKAILCNYNTRGYMIPRSDVLAGEGKLKKVTGVTRYETEPESEELLPQFGFENQSNDNGMSFRMPYSDGDWQTVSFYVFEAANRGQFPEDGVDTDWDTFWGPRDHSRWQYSPCILLYTEQAPSRSMGYPGDTNRIDLIEKVGEGKPDVWHSLLRNHSYNIVINECGMSYWYKDDAFYYAPSNIDYSLFVQSFEDVAAVAWQGPYYIAVDKSFIEYNWWQPQTVDLKISTNRYWDMKDSYRSFMTYDGDYSSSYPSGTYTMNLQSVTNWQWAFYEDHPSGRSPFMEHQTIWLSHYPYNYQFEAENKALPIVVAHYPITPSFARSNIVMVEGENGEKILTFAENKNDHIEGKTVTYFDRTASIKKTTKTNPIPANVQGLHFRWGSLIGIGASKTNGSDFESSDVVFSPSEYWKSSDWVYNTSATDSDNIPWTIIDIGEDYYYWINDGERYYFSERFGTVGYSAEDGVGDICRYISDKGWVEGRWRMPTRNEVELLYSEKTYGESIGSFNPTGGSNDSYGFSLIEGACIMGAGYNSGDQNNTGYLINPGAARVILPAAGYRNATGEQSSLGSTGHYWTTSPYADLADSFWNSSKTKIDRKANAYSIRCISEEARYEYKNE